MARSAVKSFLLVIAAAVAVALGGLGNAAPASAAVPCWKALINDWFDGHIDHIYPVACYSQAINHLPHDVEAYSSAKDDIQRAMLDAIRQARAGGGPVSDNGTSTNGSGGGGGGSSSSGGGSGSSSSSTGSEPSQKGLITRAIEWLGPSNASSVPLPLLILAGVAFLLLAAAGGSFISRRIQERRLPPPPEP
jgi:hypothetical protein